MGVAAPASTFDRDSPVGCAAAMMSLPHGARVVAADGAPALRRSLTPARRTHFLATSGALYIFDGGRAIAERVAGHGRKSHVPL